MTDKDNLIYNPQYSCIANAVNELGSTKTLHIQTLKSRASFTEYFPAQNPSNMGPVRHFVTFCFFFFFFFFAARNLKPSCQNTLAGGTLHFGYHS
jgi:hypothetical protein